MKHNKHLKNIHCSHCWCPLMVGVTHQESEGKITDLHTRARSYGHLVPRQVCRWKMRTQPQKRDELRDAGSAGSPGLLAHFTSGKFCHSTPPFASFLEGPTRVGMEEKEWGPHRVEKLGLSSEDRRTAADHKWEALLHGQMERQGWPTWVRILMGSDMTPTGQHVIRRRGP